jgi:hypothetical protein
MKKQLAVLCLLSLGIQGVAHATYPSAGEETYALPEAASFEAWGVSKRAVAAHNPFPFGGGYIDD